MPDAEAPGSVVPEPGATTPIPRALRRRDRAAGTTPSRYAHLSAYLMAHTLAIAVGVNLALFLLAYLSYTPKFLFNDDPMMMLLVAGVGRATQPTIHLLYSNAMLGWVLKLLYSITPDLAWYTLYLISGLFAAHTAFLYLAVKRAPRGLVVILYVAYFCLVGMHLLIHLQFTIVSVMLSLAGFLLLISEGRPGSESLCPGWKPLLTAQNATGVLLVVLGSLVRFDGMALACVLVTPFFLLLLRHGLYRVAVSRAVLWLIGILLSFGFLSLNKAALSRYPDVTAQVLERPQVSSLACRMPAVDGWSL